MNKLSIILTVIILQLACFALAQQTSEKQTFDMLFEGEVIGNLDFRVTETSAGRITLISNSSYTLDQHRFSCQTELKLSQITRPTSYTAIITRDGFEQRLNCRMENQRITVAYKPGSQPEESWVVDTPAREWILFDNNSISSFYLFSLQVTPGMNTIRGTTYLSPARRFAEYEIRSVGPAVMVISDETIQCDLYTLAIAGTVRFQLFINGTNLLAVKQEGTELTIRKRIN